MSDVTEITEEGTVQLEIIEVGGGTIEIISEDKTTIEIVESISTTSDLDVLTQTNTVVVDSNPSEGTSLNISEDSPTTVEIASPPVSVDIIDKVLLSGTTELSFNNLVDKPFEFDFATQKTTVNNFSSSTIITNTINSSTGSFSHIEGNSPITFRDEAIFLSDITASNNISASGDITVDNIFITNKLGIGETSIDANLHITDATTPNIKFERNGIKKWVMGVSGSNFIIDDVNDNLSTHVLKLSEDNHASFAGKITASGDISASGHLFASTSISPTTNPLDYKVLIVDTASGQFYFTGSYGGSGNVSLDLVSSSISQSLLFNGNRVITREEAGIFINGFPILNVRTTGSVVDFLEAYFFPNNPPKITNGHLNGSEIPPILEFDTSGSLVFEVEIQDDEVDLNIQTLTFTTSSTYTSDILRITSSDGLTGQIFLNVLATESLNTDLCPHYGGDLAHEFPIKVTDSFGAFTTESLFFRIQPNQSPIFRDGFQGEIISEKTLTLYETSSFSGSKPNGIIYFEDLDGDSILLETGSLNSAFTNDFELIVNSDNVEISQSSNTIETGSSPYTFFLTASDQHFTLGQDLESKSFLQYTINIIDNQDPTINPTQFNINEKSLDNELIADLIDTNTLIDPDENETNLTTTNFNLIGAFSASSSTISGSNLTESFTGTSLLDPNTDPFYIQAGTSLRRNTSVFLNQDKINLYKYNLTAQNSFTGVTGSSGIISIIIDNHKKENTLNINGSGNIIESALINNKIKVSPDGNTGENLAIIGENQDFLQHWIVTSSHGDFFEGVSFGTLGTHYTSTTTALTSSQIQIRLKENISGSSFLSGSIITCSITASQADFTTTKQFFELPIKVTENKSPLLVSAVNTENLFNTVALENVPLVTITANDPELDNLNDSSFQLIGNSSEHLSASFESSQVNGINTYTIRANKTLQGTDTNPNFIFTASISDIHNFRSSSINGILTIASPSVIGSTLSNNTDQTLNEFFIIETAAENDPVVINPNGQLGGTQAQISVDFEGFTGGQNNEVFSIEIDNDILSITNNGLISKGPTTIPVDLNVGDIITASITITDIFSNTLITTISASITEDFPPTFSSSSEENLTSSLAIGTTVANVFNISDPEGDTVTITAFREDNNNEPLIIATSGTTQSISLPTKLTASNNDQTLIIAITASDQNTPPKQSNNIINVLVAANVAPTLTITPSGKKIAPQSANTVIGTVTTSSADGDIVTVSLIDNDVQLNTNIYPYELQTKTSIPGNFTGNTEFTASVTASDSDGNTNEIFEDFFFIISGNKAPTYDLIPESNLTFPISIGQTVATLTNMNDDLNQSVSFTTNTDIPGGLEVVGNQVTSYIQTTQIINSGSNRTYNIGVTGSDDFGNPTLKDITVDISKNIAPTLSSITTFNLQAPVFHKTNVASFTYFDPTEQVDLTIGDTNFKILDNKDGTATIDFTNNTQGISGTTITDTLLTGSVTASDSFTSVFSSFSFIVSGNKVPTFSFTASDASALIKPLALNTVLGTINYSEPDGEVVTFTNSDEINLIDSTVGSIIDGVFTGSLSVRLSNATTTGNSSTLTFNVTASDSQTNTSSQEFSINLGANLPPTFTSSSIQSFFKAGEYEQSASVIQINDINDPQNLGVTISINENDNEFFLDNKSGEGFRVKVKNEISGTFQTITTHSGSITASNGVTQTSSPFTASIQGNTSPQFSVVNSTANLVVPVSPGSTVATITGVTDAQNFTTPEVYNFDDDTPFTASLLIPNLELRSTLSDGALARSVYNTITASAESTSGSGTQLVTVPQNQFFLGASATPFGTSFSNISHCNALYREKYITASAFYKKGGNAVGTISELDYAPYQIFSGDSKSWMSINAAKDAHADQVMTLDFDFGSYLGRNPIITKIDVEHGSQSQTRYEFSGSNDSITWTPIDQEPSGIIGSNKNRTIEINNNVGYKFFRITSPNITLTGTRHGPYLSSTVFYESPAPDADPEVIVPYVIETQSFGDTTNWNINYNGASDIITPQAISFDVEIYDKYGNTGSNFVDLTYTDNNPPSFTIFTASFVSPTDTIDSPISQSQIVATINSITDIDGDDPYACSVFTDGEYSNQSPNFVASVITEGDTTSFNISCSTVLSEPVDTTFDLFIKVEDNFGSFTSAQISYDIMGDNDTPIIPSDQFFTIEEHEPVGTIVGTVSATDDHTLTYTTASTYTANYFGIGNPNTGEITASQVPTANLNTSESSDGTLRHPVVIEVTDQHGAATTNTIFIRVNPNQAPYFTNPTQSFDEFEEFLPINTEIGTVNATDPENGTITYRTASSYSTTAVSCSTEGVLFFNAISTESMHNNSNSHSVSIEAVDQYGNVGSQSIHFTINPNLPPTWHKGGTGGTEVANEITESISEDLTNATASIFYYNDPNGGDALTITFTTASYWNSVLKIVDVPASQKVEIRQIGDIEFDTQPVFDFVLSASDNHFVSNSGLDPDSQTVRSLRLEVVEEANPTFNFDQHTTVNENSENGTFDVGTILSNATSFTVTHFELIGSYLVSDISNPTPLGTNLTNSYSDPLGTNYLTNPASDPFEQYGGSSSPEVRKKSNVIFNSDIINYYEYSASILSSSGNTNSGIISIPIVDHDPGTITFPDSFFIIESATDGDFIVNSDVGYSDGNNSNSQVDFAAADLVDSQEDKWSFTLTSTDNLIKNTNITPGTSLNFQLKNDLSGSALKFGNTIDINFTASLVDFPSTKLSQSISATIISNSAPTLTVVENTDNWNDVSAVNGESLITLTVVPDVENDWASTTLNGTSFTLTNSPGLTALFPDGNTINITPSSPLTVASSPYKYTASIKDIHGFRSSSVTGSIAITFGDTGSLTSGSEFMYVLDTAVAGNKVVNNDHGIGTGPLVGTQASLNVDYDLSNQVVDFNTMTAANNLFNISSTGLLSVASNITSSAEVTNNLPTIDTEIHFSSTTGTPGTGSISVQIVDNEAPTITFGIAISDLQFGVITTSTTLREFAVVDPEGLSFNNPTITTIDNSLSTSDLTITSLGSGNYKITPSANIVNLTNGITINFTVQVVDSFGKIRTQASSITISSAAATPGTLELYNDTLNLNVLGDSTFFILDTATGSAGTIQNTTPEVLNEDNFNSSHAFLVNESYGSSYNVLNTEDNSQLGILLFSCGDQEFSLTYDFGSPTIVHRYKIHTGFSVHTPHIVEGVFEGSNSPNSGYVTLDSIVNNSSTTIDKTIINSTSYRYYRIRATENVRQWGNNWMSVDLFELYTTTGGSSDSVITGSSGIPNPLKAAVFSASFDGTTENNPIPNFTISDTANFSIRNEGGLGFLEVASGFNVSNTQTPTVTISTAETSTTETITINVITNEGPTNNGITNVSGLSLDNNLVNSAIAQILNVDDTEGDFPISTTISNQIYNGVPGTYINSVNDISSAGNVVIQGNSNINNNGVGGNLTFNITLTDSKGKTTFINNHLVTIASVSPLPTPTISFNGIPYLQESDGINIKVKIDSPGVNHAIISANYATNASAVENSTFAFTSPDLGDGFLTPLIVEGIGTKIKTNQTLAFNQITHTDSPITVNVAVTTIPSNTNIHSNTVTNTSFELTITENFPPITSSAGQTVDSVLEGPMTASILTTSDTVFTINGIHDPEEDQGYTIALSNQSSTLGASLGTNLLNASAVSIGGDQSGSVTITPTQTVVDQTTGQTISFDFTLTDSFGSSTTYIDNEIEISTPPITINYGKIYIYTSNYFAGFLQDAYFNQIMGISGENSDTPPIPTILNDQPYFLSKIITEELIGTTFSQNTSQANLRSERSLTTGDNLNSILTTIGEFSAGNEAEQILILIPSSSELSGIPTSMAGSHGGSTPGEYVLNVATNGGTFAGSTNEQTKIHMIELPNAHEGFTKWTLISRNGPHTGNSFELRITPSSGSAPGA